jgi:hypothetical protein
MLPVPAGLVLCLLQWNSVSFVSEKKKEKIGMAGI